MPSKLNTADLVEKFLEGLKGRFGLWAAGLALTLVLIALFLAKMGTALLVVLLLLVYGTLTSYRPEAAIPFLLYYLFLLGDLRRFRDLVYVSSGQDLLLLVSPVTAVLLCAPLFRKLKVHDAMSKAMLWLTILMTAEIFNPLQGGLTVGVGGAMYYITPLLWFWLGREYGNSRMLEIAIYRILLPLAALAGVFGLVQNFVGFPAYQTAWFQSHQAQFVILNLGGGIRPFGFSIAPAEYETLLQMGACASFAAWLASRSAWIAIFPVLFVAILYSGGRGPLVKLVFALTFAWVARRPSNLNSTAAFRIALLLIAGLIGSYFLGNRLASGTGTVESAKTASAAALAHQAQGFADPLNERRSTVGIHSQMLLNGFIQGFTVPFGHGLGSTTAFANKFGSVAAVDTEVDFGDLFIALGLPGGLLYLYVIFLVFRYLIYYLQSHRLSVSLPVAATLVGGLGVWLEVSQYSSAAMYMFLIGCITYPKAKQPLAMPRKQVEISTGKGPSEMIGVIS